MVDSGKIVRDFAGYSLVKPGAVSLRSIVGWRNPEEYQYGEEQLTLDAFLRAVGLPLRESYGGIEDAFNLKIGELIRADSAVWSLTTVIIATKGVVTDTELTTETIAAHVSKRYTEIQSLTELFWNVDIEGNIGDAANPEDIANLHVARAKSDSAVITAAAQGDTGYGQFGYGQGGYGGKTNLIG